MSRFKSYYENRLLVVLFLFFFAAGIRLFNFAQAGQTWDETAYITDGYKLVGHIKNLDFNNLDWYSRPDHPPVAKYFYGLTAYLDKDGAFPDGKPSFAYDFNFSRLLSLLFGSLSVVLTALLGIRFFSKEIGVMAGIILATLPILVGMNQLITLESPIVLFFIATIYSFLVLLEKPTGKLIVLTAVLLGLTLGIKLTNILIMPILLAILFFWYWEIGRKNTSRKDILKILLIFPISVAIFFISWPALWFHAQETIKNVISLREPSGDVTLFLGKYRESPIYYYLVYFLVTTPLLVILLFFAGLKDLFKKPNWIYLSLVTWFIFPFVLSFYYLKQGGIRYIIEIYAPLSILSAIGLSYLAKRFSEFGFQLLYLLIPAYLLLSLLTISPYYLSYFNSILGGTSGVYQNRTFELGWWGEGQREAAIYLTKVASPGQTVGVYVTPRYLIPDIEGLAFLFYEPSQSYDYLIVNYLALVNAKKGYDSIPKEYIFVHSVEAAGAPIVNVYKRGK